MKKTIYLLLLIASCNSQTQEKNGLQPEEVMTGGACQYKKYYTKLILTDIKILRNENCEIKYYEVKDNTKKIVSKTCNSTEYEKAPALLLHIGDAIAQIHATITKGTCTPEINSFLLDTYPFDNDTIVIE
jgi:hypothetical protein